MSNVIMAPKSWLTIAQEVLYGEVLVPEEKIESKEERVKNGDGLDLVDRSDRVWLEDRYQGIFKPDNKYRC